MEQQQIRITMPPSYRSASVLSVGAVEAETLPATVQSGTTHSRLPLIKANCEEVSFDFLKTKCITPVFSKTNEVCISTPQFIQSTLDAVKDFYPGEQVENPVIYCSNLVKGRTPDAIHIPVNKLKENQKTMYYARTIFAIEIPSIYSDCNGNRLNLMVIGMKNYDRDNLSGKLVPMKFSLGIGLKCLCCCNGCFSATSVREILATRPNDIYQSALELFGEYNAAEHLLLMQKMSNYYLTFNQVSQILGKMRLLQFEPVSEQKKLGVEYVIDSHCNNIARQYSQDENFPGTANGISMWNFYNLITGANKNSYCNDYLVRSATATTICSGLCDALDQKVTAYSWYLE